MCCQVLRLYGDSAEAEQGSMATNVKETEETLPDGTVVKRRVVTTTQQELTTERVVLEPAGDEDEDWKYGGVVGDDGLQRPVFDYSDHGTC